MAVENILMACLPLHEFNLLIAVQGEMTIYIYICMYIYMYIYIYLYSIKKSHIIFITALKIKSTTRHLKFSDISILTNLQRTVTNKKCKKVYTN